MLTGGNGRRIVDAAALLEEYRTLVEQVELAPLVVSGNSMSPDRKSVV